MDLLTLINSVAPAVSITGILAVSIVLIARIYLDYRHKIVETSNEEKNIISQITPDSLDNISTLLVENFKMLNAFYAENLTQYRVISLASIAVAVLGFVVIISGMLLALIGDQVTIGTVSSIAGIVGEAAALLFFKQTKIFQDQMESSLRKLVSSQYLMTSITLARELTGALKDAEVQKIISHLRELMNGLHDSPNLRT